jgi:hypothetical protein
MGILKNIKHEKFTQGIALGKPQDAAYVDAGYKSNPPNATRVIRNDKVCAGKRGSYAALQQARHATNEATACPLGPAPSELQFALNKFPYDL